MVFNPFSDAINFLIFYFTTSIAAEGFVGILKLSFVSSIIVFPCVILGIYLHSKFNQKYTWKPVYNFFVTIFLILFLFWVINRIYAATFGGSQFLIGGIPNLIVSFIVGSIIAMFFVLLGNYIINKMKMKWKMPQPLALYLVTLIICIIFWTIVWVVSVLGILV